MTFTIGGVTGLPTVSQPQLLTMLLWGKSSSGKTVLASTAPGKKLWLQFDYEGTGSLARRDDIHVFDLAATDPRKLEMFKQGGSVERELVKAIQGVNPDTIVVDSLTSFGELALSHGILTGKANRGTFKATIETPGLTGYGVRTAMMLDFVQLVLRAAVGAGKHVIFICHEKEEYDDQGKVAEISINLGGSAANAVPNKISEIWRVEDTGKTRNIYVRNFGVHRPMRSRMFTTEKVAKFEWKYDQDKGYNNASNEGHRIEDWYVSWQTAGYNKVACPTQAAG